jgi:hypothetical protein
MTRQRLNNPHLNLPHSLCQSPYQSLYQSLHRRRQQYRPVRLHLIQCPQIQSPAARRDERRHRCVMNRILTRLMSSEAVD